MRWSEVHCSVALAEITLTFNKKTRLYARKCTFSDLVQHKREFFFWLHKRKKRKKKNLYQKPYFCQDQHSAVEVCSHILSVRMWTIYAGPAIFVLSPTGILSYHHLICICVIYSSEGGVSFPLKASDGAWRLKQAGLPLWDSGRQVKPHWRCRYGYSARCIQKWKLKAGQANLRK